MPIIHPLLVAFFAIAAALSTLTMPMPPYIRNSLSAMLGWFGVSYIIIHVTGLDLPSVSFLLRFNLILLFAVVIACALAWHMGRKRWNRK